ncbi:MAG: MprA protease, GlyGly-CTERM protein-sorting domain-containing form, partial [Verrucomicrobia bacterium]|nr:MprA protease, GlyGly-CTERM protein-sorting domain-containing form [Verrucomicrobiota bacterium]
MNSPVRPWLALLLLLTGLAGCHRDPPAATAPAVSRPAIEVRVASITA